MSDLYYEELYFEDGDENSGEDGPAKSQVQWKIFAIVYAHLKKGKDLPKWWGVRGPGHDTPNFQNIANETSMADILLKLKTPVPWRQLPCAKTEPNKGHKGKDVCGEEGFDDVVTKAPPDIRKDLEKYGSGEYAKDKKGIEKTKKTFDKYGAKDMGQAVKDKGLKGKVGDTDKEKTDKPSKPDELPSGIEKTAQKIRDYLKKNTGDSNLYAPPIKPKRSKTGPKGGKRSSRAVNNMYKKLGWGGKRFTRGINNFQKALTGVGDLRTSKSKTAKLLKKLGFTHQHQRAANRHGDWTRSPIRPGSELFNNLTKLGRMTGRRPVRKNPRMYRNESINEIKEIIKEQLNEAMSSTERMRRYNKRHPEKVSQHLKDTQDDRVERNRAHREATKKHGEEYMKDKDVHHPDGVNGEKTMVVKQDHGRDKKKNKEKSKDKSPVVKVSKSNINKKELEDIIKQIMSYIYNMGGE